jgi:aldehyde dehydrogenase (NAD+)
MKMKTVLDNLGLEAVNAGTWSARDGWLSDPGAARIDSLNPATGQSIASVLASTPEQYEQVIRSAREVAEAWRKVPAPKRGEAVRLVGEELRRHKSDLGSLVALEMGKIKAEGDGEVQEMIDIADFAVGQSRMLYGLSMHSERPNHRMFEQWQPLGVVGIISAFNFPVAVWAWNAFLAAVCGNVSVWKPSPKAALCAVAVQKLCNRVLERHGYPGIFQLFVDAGHELATRFVEDRRVDLVSFTGSTQVGRDVGERVARRLGKSLLELGGNNAIIVDESANLDLAVPSIVFGAVGTAGQRCTSTRRVFVHASRLQELERRLTQAYAQVRIGDPLDAGTLMGPLIDAGAVRRFEAAVTQAVANGGRLLTGGKALDPVPHPRRVARRGDPPAERCCARAVVRHLHGSPAARRTLPVRLGIRLRHRQREHRHVGRRDRRRLRRREGHGRRPRVRVRCLEGLHATPDLHGELGD